MPCEEDTDPSANDDTDAGHGERNDVEAADSDDGAFDFSSPFDLPADSPDTSQPDPVVSISGDRAACEKSARDAIDAIDLEMRKGFTPEKRQQHLDELLVLTQRLRECKRL